MPAEVFFLFPLFLSIRSSNGHKLQPYIIDAKIAKKELNTIGTAKDFDKA